MTALFEHRRTPAHRVIVPRPDACWVGVDLSTHSIAMAAVLASGERQVALKPLPALRGAARLAHAYGVARQLGAYLSGTWGPFGVVLVEKPLHESVVLQQFAGVIQAGIYEGCSARMEPRVDEVEASRWKLLGTGYGGHRKPKRERGGAAPAALDYTVLRWAQGAPWRYAGESWDVADACGIAEAAWQLYDLVPSG